MTMTFSSALSNQLADQFDHTLAVSGLTAAATTAAAASALGRSRGTRPNRTTKRRALLDDKQTSYSIMNRENLLALMQAPKISKLIGKYTAASETSTRTVRDQDAEDEEIFHDARDVVVSQIELDESSTTTTSTTTTSLPDDKQRGGSADESPLKTRQEQQQQQLQSAPLATGDWQLECKYTLSEVQQHNCLDDCWMVIFDKVYNITDFVHEHPGGDFILFEYAGRDATHPFLSSRHGSSAYKMLDKYWIGILVDEELYYSNNSSYCSVYLDLSWRSTPTLEDTTTSSGSSPTSSTSQTSGGGNLSAGDE